MSIYQVRTFGEILATIREEMQFSSSDTTKLNRIKRDVNAILNEIAAEKNWWWLQGSVSLQLPAYISSGTATVTAGQSTVTLTVAPAASMKDYWFAVDGFQEIYRVESHTEGALTLKLDGLFAGSTSSTATYKLWKDRIPLPTDCKETSSVYHEYFSTNLDAKGRQEFRRITALNPRAEGKPAYYYTGDFYDPSQTSSITSLPAVSTRASTGPVKTLVFASGLPTSVTSASSAGDPIRLRIQGAGDPSYNGDVLVSTVTQTNAANDTLIYTGKGELQESATSDSSISVTQLDQEAEYDRYRELFLYPCLNTSRVLIHVDYIKQVLPLNNDSDEPVIPLEDRMVLVYGALSRAWSRDRNPDEAARNLGMYKNKLAKMAGKLQDSQESPRFAVNKEYLRSKRNISMRGGLNGFAPPLSGSGSAGSSVVTGTANSAAIFNSSGELVASTTISDTELGYLDGANSNIQTQIDSKASAASPTFTGTITAPTFAGNLTGNVTGNVSGSSGSCTGNAATVTTNANLTGVITSVGNATSINSQTGTGSKFVVDTSPTLVTPVIGAATGTSLSVSGQLTSTASTGTAPLVVSSTTRVANLNVATAGNADTVTTNANLTGDVTSVGNATTLANAPVIAKVLTGYTSGAGTISSSDSILSAIQKLNGNDATNANLTGDVTSVGNATTYSATVGPTKGGTNQTTYTKGDTLYSDAANSLAKLGIGTSGQFLKVSSGVPAWGPGASGINYLSSNPDAEADTAGWATYADSGATPVDATGGSPTTTWARSTSSPLRGTGSFLLTKDAANRQGEGASYAITLDSADQAKPICISFDYAVASGTYADGDLTVYLYDVTNSLVIQPAPYKLLSATAGLSQKWIGYFQTSAASTSYRLAVHVASTSASAYTVKFDNWTVGPTYQSYGAVATDWTAYTPTFTGFGTQSNVNFASRRVGGGLEIMGRFTTGTCTATQAQITLGFAGGNGNVSISSSAGLASGANLIGTGTYGTNTASGLMVLGTPANSYMQFGLAAAGNAGLTPANGSTVFFNAGDVSIHAFVPIAGWSSNVQVSSDADTRVVAANYTGNAGTVLTGGTTNIDWSTKVSDTHSAFSGTTFTAPVPGFYRVSGIVKLTAGAAIGIYMYVNAVKKQLANTIASAQYHAFNGGIYLNAGDALTIRSDTGATLSNNATDHVIYIAREGGPAQIAASEKVRLQYVNNAGTALTANVTNIDFSTKVVDSHGAWSGTVFTAPRADFYVFNGSIRTGSSTLSVNAYVNGSAVLQVSMDQTDAFKTFAGARYLNAGDTLSFRSDTNATLSASATTDWVSIWSQ